jgi:hypothetical protein
MTNPVLARRRLPLAGATLATLALVAAACGGGAPAAVKASTVTSKGTAPTTSAVTAAPGSGGARGSGGAPGSGGTVTAGATGTAGPADAAGPAGGGRAADAATFTPAASGTIASIQGGTLEVQSPQSGQTTVKITAKTLITATVKASLSSVRAGACITATGTKGAKGAVAAADVVIQAAVKGSCRAGGGFGGVVRRAGFAGSGGGAPTGTRPPTAVSRPANFATASGKVLSVSSGAIKVSGFSRSFSGTFPGRAPSSTAAPKVKPVAKTVTVTVKSSTRYSKLEAGSAKSLKVGECATAFGTANNIGAVTATRLSVSPAPAGGCTSGFGGGPGGFRGALAAAPGATAVTAGIAPAATQVGGAS